MAYLLYGVKQGEGFIVVTGNVGTGKTTLVQNLLRVLKSEDVIVAQIVSTQIGEDDLLRLVAASFGLPYEGIDKARLLRDLEAFFVNCAREGKRVLLIIDEAQNLPKRSIEELRMLSNFQISGRSLVQSFLLGQKEFRVTMRSAGFEQLRQRVIAAYHLRPLDEDETKGYVQHRLRKVGWKNDPQISDDAFKIIFEFNEGVPRRINLFCDRMLLFAYLEEKHQIDEDMVRTVAKDIIEEQGGELENTGSILRLSIPEVGDDEPGDLQHGAGRRDALSLNQEKRLGAVEESVTALTEAMRQELSMLRQALAQQNASNKDKDK